MLSLIVFLIAFIMFLRILMPYSSKLAQYMESKRLERDYELQRLQEENHNRYYEEYIKNKQNKRNIRM